jgi:hypothetical protein
VTVINNEFIESQALSLNLVTKKIMTYFNDAENYTRLGFALSTGNEKIKKLVQSIETAYSRVNELCLRFSYKRATHYAMVLKYLVKKLDKELQNVYIQ